MSGGGPGKRAEYYNFVYCHGSGAHVNNPFTVVVSGSGTETHPREDNKDGLSICIHNFNIYLN